MTPNTAKEASTNELLSEVTRYQAIQKQCAPSSDNWADASEALAILFAELNARQGA